MALPLAFMTNIPVATAVIAYREMWKFGSISGVFRFFNAIWQLETRRHCLHYAPWCSPQSTRESSNSGLRSEVNNLAACAGYEEFANSELNAIWKPGATDNIMVFHIKYPFDTCKQIATLTLDPKVVLTARDDRPMSLKSLEKD